MELSDEDAKKLGKSSRSSQKLLTLTGSNANASASCTDLSKIAVATKLSNQSCRKVSVDKVVSTDGKTLSALFNIDSSGCNRWWIILVSVLAAVVLIGAIIIAVSVITWQNHQNKKLVASLGRTHG